MLGAIAGDIIGSAREVVPIKTKSFELFPEDSRFTDDSVTTIAVARAILAGEPYGPHLHDLSRTYGDAGYGGLFIRWLVSDDPRPYGSWGNGAAMRASPVGHAFADETTLLEHARQSAAPTHDHPEGIKGAQSVALAVRMARDGAPREAIRSRITTTFGYDLSRTLDEIRPDYAFEISCQRTVPEAIIAFLESTSFEDAVRNAISLGGDSDTLACITGSIAEAYYEYGEGRGGGRGISQAIRDQVATRLTPDLAAIVQAFYKRFG